MKLSAIFSKEANLLRQEKQLDKEMNLLRIEQRVAMKEKERDKLKVQLEQIRNGSQGRASPDRQEAGPAQKVPPEEGPPKVSRDRSRAQKDSKIKGKELSV